MSTRAHRHMTFRFDWIRDAKQYNSKVTTASDEMLISNIQGKVALKISVQGKSDSREIDSRTGSTCV